MMRGLALVLSLSLHIAAAIALPPRPPVATKSAPEPAVPLVWVAPLVRKPHPAAEPRAARSVQASPPKTFGPARTAQAAPRPVGKRAKHPTALAARSRALLPIHLAKSGLAGVEVEAAVAQPVPVAPEAAQGVEAVEFVASGAIGAHGDATGGALAGDGHAAAELDGRGGDANPVVAAWLRALRAHLRRCHHYPDWLIERGLEGTVELRLVIFADGRLGEATEGTGNTLLVQAAKEVLADAGRLPKPPELLGSAVRVRMPLTFRLEGQ